MLSKYRVLDLSNEQGDLCGKILADLGADVIKVEPLEGAPSRNVSPFAHHSVTRESSLYWLAYSSGKRSITLAIGHPEGRNILLQLLSKADFLVESFSPGHMEKMQLGYSDLRSINPKLIMVAITPFGQTGPMGTALHSDLTGIALGGMMWLTGDADRPPTRISLPQFYELGSAAAAAGAMIAHYSRKKTGRGQFVDVSCQQAVARTLAQAPATWHLTHKNLERSGPYRDLGKFKMRINWECSDGYVNFIVTGGISAAREMKALSEWMLTKGQRSKVLEETKWEEVQYGTFTQELLNGLESDLSVFFKIMTKKELFEGSIERKIMLFPVNTMEDLVTYEQLSARQYFHPVYHPQIDATVTLPGPFLKASGKALRPPQPAPMLGQHNKDIYLGELHYTPKQLSQLRKEKVIG
jgi:crotonobetainyl-CoA:carnitine CoA-transferase CaiB-like acyl-CoA transferase